MTTKPQPAQPQPQKPITVSEKADPLNIPQASSNFENLPLNLTVAANESLQQNEKRTIPTTGLIPKEVLHTNQGDVSVSSHIFKQKLQPNLFK